MEVPEEGSDDWLWFHPEPEKGSWKWREGNCFEYYYQFRHDPCEVTFYAKITAHNRIQCWACGKYLRKPKS